jgi:hypothetical protein
MDHHMEVTICRAARLVGLLAAMALPALIASGPASADTSLQPLVIKTHGSPADSGTELGSNHFQVGPILKEHGQLYVSLKLRWKTSDGRGVDSYCNEHSKVVDGNGNVVLDREQRLAVCDNGGNWGFHVPAGSYTYVLDVAGESGGNLHAEQQFVVDP